MAIEGSGLQIRANYADGMRDGLIDIHCHGAVGVEFGTTTQDSRRAVEHHAEKGTSAVVASLVSARLEEMIARALALVPLLFDRSLAGIHLEGPFLAAAARGAHDPALLQDPDPDYIEAVVGALADAGREGAVKQVTFAPELPGSTDLIRVLGELDIVPALGHTAASAEQMRAAIETVQDVCGRPPIITHLFNGMPAFHHRNGGPAAEALAAGARGEAFVELIADGVHVAPEVVRLVFDTVDPGHIVLVSDAMAATGLGDGDYRLGSLDVVVDDGVARLPGSAGAPGPIAGSTRTLMECLTWAIDVAGVPESAALRAASENPRLALGLL